MCGSNRSGRVLILHERGDCSSITGVNEWNAVENCVIHEWSHHHLKFYTAKRVRERTVER